MVVFTLMYVGGLKWYSVYDVGLTLILYYAKYDMMHLQMKIDLETQIKF